MPRLPSVPLVTILLALSVSSDLEAQYAVGAGLTVPTSDYAGLSKPGWMVAADYLNQ